MKEEIKFLLTHSSIYGVGSVVSRAVSFLLLPLYTKYLTPQDYGILELINVTTNTMGVVIGLGISQSMNRFYFEPSMENDRRCVVSTTYYLAATVAGAIIAFVGIEADLFAEWILDSATYGQHFMLAFLSLFLGIFIDIAQSYFRLLYRPVLYTCVSLASLIGGISLNVLFIVHLNYGVLGAIYGNFFTLLFVAIPLTLVVLYRVGLRFKWSVAKEMLKYSLGLLPAELAHSVVNYSDRYFIKHYVSIADAGIYGLANKIGTSIHILITSPFLSVFLSRRFEIAGRNEAPQIFSKIFDCYMLVIVFTGLALSVFIEEIMHVMTTPEFYRAGTLVPLIVLTMVALGMKYHFEFGILYSKKTHYYSALNLFTAAVHIILNIILVSTYGVWGALYASFVAVFLTTVMVYLVSRRLYHIDFQFRNTVRAIAAAVLIFFVSRLHVGIGMGAAIGYKMLLLSVFPILLVWMKVISTEEIEQVKSMFTKAGLSN